MPTNKLTPQEILYDLIEQTLKQNPNGLFIADISEKIQYSDGNRSLSMRLQFGSRRFRNERGRWKL